ncbi:proline-rich protein 29-like [Myxocyprinus asiaticus]|uniref:proline-rich protein 29-like n=1 Tax=Myxocyprinus asiaticus TaxID=70543 RepID=UPI002223C784|nr:proline-rich protein 29-like [Myxocyprinus asiaticus]
MNNKLISPPFCPSKAPQATTIFHQLTEAVTSPFAPVHPGHIREELVELMMIQNAQMHQVVMNNMTIFVLNSFDCTHTPEVMYLKVH